jgi:pyruvate formate lyase activating enzyme
MPSGCVFNIQRYCLHDGPGIRTTVFLKGCPLDCWWCHNPESRDPQPRLMWQPGRCVRCGACEPASAQQHPGSQAASEWPTYECVGCGSCAAPCPTEARQIVGRTMTVADVMAEVRADRVFYDDSGGGVTFSGGEPLMQAEFLIALLAACRREAIHTAMDTCGFAPQADLLAAADLAGLILYDVKLVNDAAHRRYTGVSNATILENLRALGERGRPVWLRVPLIPGVNDQADELAAIARLAAGLPCVEQVNLLPYHATARHKSQRLGQADRLGDAAPPTAEQLRQAAAIFADHGLHTILGG